MCVVCWLDQSFRGDWLCWCRLYYGCVAKVDKFGSREAHIFCNQSESLWQLILPLPSLNLCSVVILKSGRKMCRLLGKFFWHDRVRRSGPLPPHHSIIHNLHTTLILVDYVRDFVEPKNKKLFHPARMGDFHSSSQLLVLSSLGVVLTQTRNQ